MNSLYRIISFTAVAAATAYVGYRVGRAVQRNLSQMVLVELYEELGTNEAGVEITSESSYLKVDETGFQFVQRISQATPITLEAALAVKKFYQGKLSANQEIHIMPAGDAALIQIVEDYE